MVTEEEKVEEKTEEKEANVEEQCTEEVKQGLVDKINSCREAVRKLINIAPDVVPHFLRVMAETPEEATRTRLDELLAGHEDDEKRMAFCQMMVVAMTTTAESLGRYEAELKLRTQPEGEPRVKRQFQGFKKRQGSW